MKKTTKGALAAGAAGVLLLGGAGTLAYWTDDATIDGTDINSGNLKLTGADCGDGWILDAGLPSEAVYAGTELLVPGDTLTQECTYTVSAEGDHLEAEFDVELGAGLTGAAGLVDELDVSGTSFSVGATSVTPGTPVEVADGDTVTATISVEWPYGSEDNDANDVAGLTAALADIAVTVTQVDTH